MGWRIWRQRQAEGAAGGHRWSGNARVLMAVLNLAVDFEALDRNRLRRLPVPLGSKRERILDAIGSASTEAVASEAVWRPLWPIFKLASGSTS